MACRPRLLICDEPTTALDVTIQAEILALIDRLKRENGMAVMFITHDFGVVADIADHVIVMNAGEVVERGPVRDVMTNPQHPYTKKLMAAVPIADPQRRHRERSLLVVGTDHAAESVTGFFTKFGDGGADIRPLSGLNKRQNQLLLRVLGASERLWAKPPTADLLDGIPGRTDEDELGITYPQIDDYLEGKEIDPAVAEKLETIYLRSRHKRTVPVGIADTWWK